jgi:hypothetical protein
MPKPEKRTMTKIVHVDYWWCGDPSCTRTHATEDTAARCPKANRGLRVDLSERNEGIWKMVVIEGASVERAGVEHGVTGSRANQIIRKIARKKGIKSWGFRSATIDEIREAGKRL